MMAIGPRSGTLAGTPAAMPMCAFWAHVVIIPSRKATKQYLGEGPMMKLDADEKELLDSVGRGEWKSVGGGKRERARYVRYAKATFRKDRRLNIRLSSKDLEAIQKRALEEGLPYQTLVSSLLHKYAAGRLKEV
jgi:predicted DNA binding CopG/RHH family protein